MSTGTSDRVMDVFGNPLLIGGFVDFEIALFEIKREAISILVLDAIEENVLMPDMTARKLILSIEQTIVVNRANDFVLHIKNILLILNDLAGPLQFLAHELLYRVRKTG